MNDELLFGLVEECVAFAVARLEASEPLSPFAMAIDGGGVIESFHNKESGHEKSYELLLETLRDEARKGKIEAIALLARVTIPSNYNPDVPEGLRVHIEERSKAGEKIAARFLYIPYQLYRANGGETKLMVKLYNPIPVGFQAEIF